MNLSLFHLCVIIPGIIILQYHGILFWLEAVDKLTGWAWSVLLEIIAFWCWFQPDRGINLRLFYFNYIKALAVLATLLLLIGPLFTVSKDLVQDLGATGSAYALYLERKSNLEKDKTRKEEQAEKLLKIIEKTNDGYRTFNKTNNELLIIRQELDNLRPPKLETQLSLQAISVVLMQALAIFLIQIVIVLAILRLAKAYRGDRDSEANTRTDEMLLEVRSLFLRKHKTVDELAKEYNIEARAIRYILNYQNLMSQGLKPISSLLAKTIHDQIFEKKETLEKRKYQFPNIFKWSKADDDSQV